jgi:hypothetical protein
MVSSSLTPSNNSNSLYDFTKAEAMLIDRYLTGLPAIDLEQSGFVYTQEQQGAINILRQKLRQERLPVDIIDAIKRDIANPAQAQRILQLLGNVIDFLGATGGAVLQSLGEGLGDMPLIKYARTVLLLEEDFGSRAIARQVRSKGHCVLITIATRTKGRCAYSLVRLTDTNDHIAMSSCR